MNILIVTGGSSSERKISLISARAVRKALLTNGHRVTMFDFKKGLVALKKLLPAFDMTFPVMHGYEGENGDLYSFFRSNKMPYVGSDPKGARIAFDKMVFKKYCKRKKIPTADWMIVKNSKDIKRFGFPCVLKGAWGGSSNEVFILKSEKDLSHRMVSNILKLKNGCFVEKLLTGVEITVGILQAKALPVLEIVPPVGKWFDSKYKYSGETKEIPFPTSVTKKMQALSQKIALDIHIDLKLGSFSRTDIIVQDSTPYVIEANTPGGVGFTPQSLFPKAAQAAGISFEDLIERLITK